MPKVQAPPPLLILSTANAQLQSIMRQLDLTPAQFGRELGYKSNLVYKMLSGERPVTFDTLGRIYKRYGSKAAQALATYVEF